jgi:hypothetical protein
LEIQKIIPTFATRKDVYYGTGSQKNVLQELGKGNQGTD